MRVAIEKVRGQLGHEYDLVVGGKRIKTADKIKSVNPAKPFASSRSSPEGWNGACGTRDDGRAKGF